MNSLDGATSALNQGCKTIHALELLKGMSISGSNWRRQSERGRTNAVKKFCCHRLARISVRCLAAFIRELPFPATRGPELSMPADMCLHKPQIRRSHTLWRSGYTRNPYLHQKSLISTGHSLWRPLSLFRLLGSVNALTAQTSKSNFYIFSNFKIRNALIPTSQITILPVPLISELDENRSSRRNGNFLENLREGFQNLIVKKPTVGSLWRSQIATSRPPSQSREGHSQLLGSEQTIEHVLPRSRHRNVVNIRLKNLDIDIATWWLA